MTSSTLHPSMAEDEEARHITSHLQSPIEGDPFAKICDVELKHREGCMFDARFRTKEGDLLMREPFGIGIDYGPEAVTLFTMSAAYCMAASLNYYLAKARVLPTTLRAKGHVEMRLTDEHYRRIKCLDIDIRIEVAEKEHKRLERALSRFNDFCIITESIRGSFPVRVQVEHPWGTHKVVLD